LTLFKPRVFLINHIQASFAPDYFAVGATLLNGCFNFHWYKIYLLRSNGTRMQELIPIFIVANLTMLVSFFISYILTSKNPIIYQSKPW